MVTKSKTAGTQAKKGRVKVGKLQLNKETVKDLTASEQKRVKGGATPIGLSHPCHSVKFGNCP